MTFHLLRRFLGPYFFISTYDEFDTCSVSFMNHRFGCLPDNFGNGTFSVNIYY